MTDESASWFLNYWWIAWAGTAFVGGIVGLFVITFEWSAMQKFACGALLGGTFTVTVFANRLIAD
jgi:hypothetical protein